ncbi:MAG: glycosyltransferase family 9 protein [Gemmatimonadota bacterium]|nr:MAG: glycosyltransferase family 9 protein [Gemmatimonadota bacterium]
MASLEIPSRRICLVLPSGIGDVVHGLPLVNALKRDDPDRHITWIVEPTPAPLLQHHPAVDDVILFDHRQGLGAALALRRELRRRNFDLLINCGLYFKTVLPTLFARARLKLGYGRDRANDLIWLFVDRLPPRGPRHRQDMYLEFLEPLGVTAEPVEWRIVIGERERAAAAEFFAGLRPERVAGIVTTSAMDAKDWAVDRLAAVATALERDFGFLVVLLGGPGRRETERARQVAMLSEARTVWALGPDLRWLIGLIEGCDLVIAPDTGPLHIARALGTPVIGLYGHTDPLRAGPYRAFQDLTIDRFNLEAEGRPYAGPLEREHPGRAGARHRMGSITVADVLERVEVAIGRYLLPEASL